MIKLFRNKMAKKLLAPIVIALLIALGSPLSAHAESGTPPVITGPHGYLVATISGGSGDCDLWIYKLNGSSWDFQTIDRAEYLVTLPVGTYTTKFVDNQTGETRWYGGGVDAATATQFTIVEESFTRISDAFVGLPAVPGGFVQVDGTPRIGLPVTAVTGWDSDSSISVTYAWKDFLGNILGQGNTYTHNDSSNTFVTLWATAHKIGFADTTVKTLVIFSSTNSLVTSLRTDPLSGSSGQFDFFNDQATAVQVRVELNGSLFATATVPAGSSGSEGTASIQFSNLNPGDNIAAGQDVNPFFGLTSYTRPLSWRPTLVQSEALAGGTLPISGEGFTPGSQVELSLHSVPIALTTLTADANGNLQGQVTIPGTAPVGSHTIGFSVAGVMRGQAPIKIASAGGNVADGGLAETGTNSLPLILMALIFMLAGVALTGLVAGNRKNSTRVTNRIISR